MFLDAITEQISLPLALVDVIPVVLFIVAGIFVLIDFKKDMPKVGFAIAIVGFFGVAFAGLIKVIWKFHCVGGYNILWMDKSFFGIQSFSYLILAIGTLWCAVGKKKDDKSTVTVAAFSLTMIFVLIQVIGCAAFIVGLILLTRRQTKLRALSIVLLVLAFVFMLAMGYLASKFDDSSSMHWIAQVTNIFGQALLLGGTLVTHFNIPKVQE